MDVYCCSSGINRRSERILIISHKYKFIFIKTKKTAGTSIEVYLSQFCGEDDVVTPIWPHVEPHRARNYQGLWNPLPEIIESRGRDLKTIWKHLWRRHRYVRHLPATIIRARTSREVWETYFKFCVERNPWDKTLSHYAMINDRKDGGLTLDEYFDRRWFCINYPKYTDSRGSILVDRVLKYESLMQELSQVFGQLGIPFEGSLGVRAKSEHRTDRRPYQEVFTSRQREIIDKAFAPEIAMHGYVF